MNDGNDRSCERCNQIFESNYFPYKSVRLCINCYEFIHGITLHQKRRELGRKKTTANLSRPGISTSSMAKVCPYCQSESLIVDKIGSVFCKNCKVIIKQASAPESSKRCPNCKSDKVEKKGIRNEKQRFVCRICGKNWTTGNLISNDIGKLEDDLKREDTLENIISYLKKQKEENKPITFYYRQDVTPRKFNSYFIDDRYVHVRSAYGKHITFLIDKIRKI